MAFKHAGTSHGHSHTGRTTSTVGDEALSNESRICFERIENLMRSRVLIYLTMAKYLSAPPKLKRALILHKFVAYWYPYIRYIRYITYLVPMKRGRPLSAASLAKSAKDPRQRTLQLSWTLSRALEAIATESPRHRPEEASLGFVDL